VWVVLTATFTAFAAMNGAKPTLSYYWFCFAISNGTINANYSTPQSHNFGRPFTPFVPGKDKRELSSAKLPDRL
jgi:hypothetical protein